MFRILFRLVAPVEKRIIQPTSRSVPAAAKPVPPTSGCHRDRLLSMRIEHTRLCSNKRCQLLSELGFVTAGDLLTCHPDQMAQRGIAPKTVQIIKRYRQAIRLAIAVPGMMPRDAQLLICIHRRSVGGLANETPGALHRDLERFALSSKGRRLLHGRRVPSLRRLKRWISDCKSVTAGSSPVAAARGDGLTTPSLV